MRSSRRNERRKPGSRCDVKSSPKTNDRPQSVTEADINRWIDQDPVIAGLTAKLAKDEALFNAENHRIRGIARNAASDPAMLRLKDDIAGSRRFLKNKRAALRPVAIRQLRDQEKTDHGRRETMGPSRSWRCSATSSSA